MQTHPMDGWVMVICNPISGSGLGIGRLARLRRAFEEAGIRYTSEVTGAKGHASLLARAAVQAGCSTVIAIGGDGTLFEVVNGIMRHDGSNLPLRDGVAVGLVQAGRGSDFGRSAGIPTDVDTAIERLLEGRTDRIDLGHVQYHSSAGEVRERFFVNAAGMGFDAEVTVRANSAPRVLGGTVPYLSSLFTTLVSYRNKHITITIGGENVCWKGKANSMVVANGQFFGGGMKIAPEAALSDGEFDLVILGDFDKIDLVRNVPRVYDGSHLTHPKVHLLRAHEIEATSPDRLLLQADGEVLGRAPARFSIVPGALTLIV